MSTKLILPLTVDYVKDWSLHNAFTELAQNCLDAAKQFHSISYDIYSSQDRIVFMTTLSEEGLAYTIPLINKSHFALGVSTKQSDSNTIGMYGEGLKLALLILAREGCNINIYSGALWFKCYLDYSEDFQVGCLTVEVKESKNYSAGTVIEISHDTEYERILQAFNDFKSKQLFHKDIRDTAPLWKAESGEILNITFNGDIFIDGLFIAHVDYLTFGYNFKPGKLSLTRDRHVPDKFEVLFKVKDLWAEAVPPQTIADYAEEDIEDLYYFEYADYSVRQSVANHLYTSVSRSFSSAVSLVSTEQEKTLQKLGLGDNIRAIGSNLLKLLKHATNMPEEVKLEGSPSDILQKWYNQHSKKLSGFGKKEFKTILIDSISWRKL